VSKVCVRPGPNQPRGRLPENFSMMSIDLSITARSSSSLCIGT
jgi:hypothetical protein